tara:strand:+ start:11451 stop:12122 length:672 start_codon:yes stop_codon:yes gene_type:complete
MNKLTLVIPAKKESESLPYVLEELKKYSCKKIIILEPTDEETINSIKNFDCEIVYQTDKGYGDAINLGINNVETEYFCIFNADGSFNPQELGGMYKQLDKNNFDVIFASRYEKNCGSEDDTFITYIGNFIFTKIGNIFFRLNITDILYTFVMAKTHQIQKLNLIKKDFCFCVELPIKAKRAKYNLANAKSYERARISGKKKVNALKDGFSILVEMIKLFFKSI